MYWVRYESWDAWKLINDDLMVPHFDGRINKQIFHYLSIINFNFKLNFILFFFRATSYIWFTKLQFRLKTRLFCFRLTMFKLRFITIYSNSGTTFNDDIFSNSNLCNPSRQTNLQTTRNMIDDDYDLLLCFLISIEPFIPYWKELSSNSEISSSPYNTRNCNRLSTRGSRFRDIK